MQKLIKSLLRDKAIYIAIFLTLIVVYLSLANLKGKLIIYFNYIDKIHHTLAYFFLTISWLSVFIGKQRKNQIVLLCIAFGILMEFLQSNLTNYRLFEYLDIVANTVGVLIGLLFFNRIEKNLINMLNSL
ncbi:VanZ family protein [Tenacibaculum sp. ZS6-P6]|uniref:VanZ family protein n=1 Tax=Tenacibaculum sp. ZS6-P6 TaxID=3447503 RepID=UPI003F9513C5